MNVKYTKELLETIVKESFTVAEIMRRLGLRESGGSHSHLSRKLKEYKIDTSHFKKTVHNFGKISPQRKSWQEVLVLRTNGRRQYAYRLRRALIESGRRYVCECGQLPMWNGKELRLQVDHLNRNWLDDRPENLRFICPHCHTQTNGYNGSKGFSDLTDINRYSRSRRKGRVAQRHEAPVLGTG